MTSPDEEDRQKRVTSLRQSLFEDEEEEDAELKGGKDEEKKLTFEHVEEIGKFCVLDHDIVFWMGDLNYRIKKDVEISRVYDLLDHVISDEDKHNSEEAFHMLLSFDQLNIERAARRVFPGFSEGEIKFLPTYKYIPGDVNGYYDRRPDKKMRKPAWCDRILWKVKERGRDGTKNSESVELIQYRRVDGFFVSDHKPVNALFKVRVKNEDDQLKKQKLAEVIKTADEVKAKNFAKVCCESMFSFLDVDVMKTTRLMGESAWNSSESDYKISETVVVENISDLATARIRVLVDQLPPWLELDGDTPTKIGPGGSVNISVRLRVDEIIPGSEVGYTFLTVEVENGNNVVIPAEYREKRMS